MSAVDQDARVLADHLHPPGNVHLRESLDRPLVVYFHADDLELVQQRQGQPAVERLVLAQQRNGKVLELAAGSGQAHAGVTARIAGRFHAVAEFDVFTSELEIRLGLLGDQLEGPFGLGNLGDADGRCLRLEDARLFRRNLAQRLTELVHMIEGNAGYTADIRLQDVRAVEAPAETGFYHGDVHFFSGEVAEGDGREYLEEGGLVVGHLLYVRPALVYEPRQGRSGNILAVDRNPLANVNYVRGGIEPDLVAAGLEHLCEHCRGRALALRPGDMDGADLLVGCAQLLQQPLHADEAERVAVVSHPPHLLVVRLREQILQRGAVRAHRLLAQTAR